MQAMMMQNGKRLRTGTHEVPMNFKFLEAYSTSGTWTCPATGKYRIYCFGACGAGGAGGSCGRSSAAGGGGGSGGNSGAVVVSDLNFTVGDTVPITINSSISSFGNEISAQAGAAGGVGGYGAGNDWGDTGIGGQAPYEMAMPFGGNILAAYGARGGRGGGRDGNAARGANNGGQAGGSGDAGGGGANYSQAVPANKYVKEITGTTGKGAIGERTGTYGYQTGYSGAVSSTPPNIQIGCAGGGGYGSYYRISDDGSASDDGRVGPSSGGDGATGMIIIEKEVLDIV